MDKKIGLVVALIGIVILLFSIFLTASTKSNQYYFLLPVGLFLSLGGSMYYMFKSRGKKLS